MKKKKRDAQSQMAAETRNAVNVQAIEMKTFNVIFSVWFLRKHFEEKKRKAN